MADEKVYDQREDVFEAEKFRIGIPVEGGHVFKKNKPHSCRLPEARQFDVGDEFVCGSCQRRYVLLDAQTYQGGPYWSVK